VGQLSAAESTRPEAIFEPWKAAEIAAGLEIPHIGAEVGMGMRGGGPPSLIKRDSHHPAQILGNEGVGLSFDPLRDMSVGGAALGRGVFEAAESRPGVGWGGDHGGGPPPPRT